MPSYVEYQKQIEELSRLAEAQRASEIGAAKEQIRSIMNTYGLTIDDLDTGRKLPNKQRDRAPIKYKDEATGETWSGRGRTPRWLEGKDRSQYLIKS